VPSLWRGKIDAVKDTWTDADERGADEPAGRTFTLGSLAVAVGVCAAWWVVALTTFFVYANSRSDTAAASGCTATTCPSERSAMLTLGFFGLLPTAFIGLLVSLVVLVYTARALPRPFLLGTASALAGMVLAAVGFVTIATFDS
jgi:mannose/fructose/N-acetylgalactosamine-specific phosphotransferase system component IIC